jgi:hypothetical protein
MYGTLDDWISVSFTDTDMFWNVNITEEMLDIAYSATLEENCKLAVMNLPSSIGSRPAVCFSGGIDSQTVIDTFLYAGVTPEVVIFNFLDDHNIHDVSHAIKFCETRNITPRLIDLDVIRFLNNKLYDFATKYKISSPQFAVHLYLAGKLKDLGYTSAIFGGNNLTQYADKSWYTPTKEETDWCKYSQEINFPIIGSFWLQDWRLSLMATIFTPYVSTTDASHRYQSKILSYKTMGYDVIPQEQKYNGFETIKKYYEEMTGDGWTFEHQFRNPIKKFAGIYINNSVMVAPEISTRINIMKQKIRKSNDI